MRAVCLSGTILLFGLAITLAVPAGAQDAKKGPPPAVPQAAPPAKSAPDDKSAPSEQTMTPRQLEVVKRVSAYFNDLNNMRGRFVQTDPDKTRLTGRFYVKKPGRFRFDYGPPTRKVMASDGRYLRIKDPDISGEDVVELDNTPFRLLLKKDVDLLRDARILEVLDSEDLSAVTMQDKSPDAPGRVQLYFTKKPGFDLKEWTVTDAQGLVTRVEVSDLNKADEIDPKLFVWESNNSVLRQ